MPKDLHTPQWFLLTVGSKQEQKVALALQAKGLEVFLPMQRVRRQWSDRVKVYTAPLFNCNLFCRFPHNSRALGPQNTPRLFHL
jgi:transcriptional antiterminator RfaH